MDRRLAMKEMQLECQDGMHREQICIVHPSVDEIRNTIRKTVTYQV